MISSLPGAVLHPAFGFDDNLSLVLPLRCGFCCPSFHRWIVLLNIGAYVFVLHNRCMFGPCLHFLWDFICFSTLSSTKILRGALGDRRLVLGNGEERTNSRRQCRRILGSYNELATFILRRNVLEWVESELPLEPLHMSPYKSHVFNYIFGAIVFEYFWTEMSDDRGGQIAPVVPRLR
ncbi:hypothetical protein NPIL_555771 [Nephila pilipes]|uniref:Uncharacterized protein n=1 Tax=Nephila pilipes TaxID=299642 RepID=A0A8X6TMT5_NEPPI|nr:hypothetical protein NPIL_555771 [Nephila pilipes]